MLLVIFRNFFIKIFRFFKGMVLLALYFLMLAAVMILIFIPFAVLKIVYFFLMAIDKVLDLIIRIIGVISDKFNCFGSAKDKVDPIYLKSLDSFKSLVNKED